jgi:hypothetical protein
METGAAAAGEEEVWERRLAKRVESIAIVKNTANYRSFARSPCAERSTDGPRTPSPGGRVTTARQFRYRIKLWRQSLHEWNEQAAADTAE